MWGKFYSVLTDDEIKVWPCFLTLFTTLPFKMNAFIISEPPKDNGGAEINKYIVEIDDGRGNVLLYSFLKKRMSLVVEVWIAVDPSCETSIGSL